MLAITTLMGLPALRIRVSGVASGIFYELNINPATLEVSGSTAYAMSLFIRTSYGWAPEVQFRQAQSNDALISVSVLGLSTAWNGQYASVMTRNLAARGRLRLTYSVTSGQAYSEELLISCPQIEAGTAPTSPLTSTRAADTGSILIGGSSPSLHMEDRDGAYTSSGPVEPALALSSLTATAISRLWATYPLCHTQRGQ